MASPPDHRRPRRLVDLRRVHPVVKKQHQDGVPVHFSADRAEPLPRCAPFLETPALDLEPLDRVAAALDCVAPGLPGGRQLYTEQTCHRVFRDLTCDANTLIPLESPDGVWPCLTAAILSVVVTVLVSLVGRPLPAVELRRTSNRLFRAFVFEMEEYVSWMRL